MHNEEQEILMDQEFDSDKTLSEEDLVFLAHELGICNDKMEDMVVSSLTSSVDFDSEDVLRK